MRHEQHTSAHVYTHIPTAARVAEVSGRPSPYCTRAPATDVRCSSSPAASPPAPPPKHSLDGSRTPHGNCPSQSDATPQPPYLPATAALPPPPLALDDPPPPAPPPPPPRPAVAAAARAARRWLLTSANMTFAVASVKKGGSKGGSKGGMCQVIYSHRLSHDNDHTYLHTVHNTTHVRKCGKLDPVVRS